MKDETYKKVYIRSVDDLPKVKCSIIYKNASGIHSLEYEDTENDNKYLLKYAYWYLQPIEPLPAQVSDEMIERWARDKAEETGYDVTGIRAKMISIGAKAIRDGKIK